MQQHLIARLVQALGADAECVCSRSSSAVPTVSSLTPAAPSVPGPLAKERERGSGSDMGLQNGTEDEERGKGGERECVIRALERGTTPHPGGKIDRRFPTCFTARFTTLRTRPKCRPLRAVHIPSFPPIPFADSTRPVKLHLPTSPPACSARTPVYSALNPPASVT
ncbi:hypothetical protein B0H14DRAFT_3865576 [Mycena olivaceomarginata]|nr:hypothetical protein B0H14DRAFT_3865576 [Mycena olivaceomarginata]